MVSQAKKQYMKTYNQLPKVKAKKANYMKVIRAEQDKLAARELVSFLAEMGYEDMAVEYALERAPEMLITVKNATRKANK